MFEWNSMRRRSLAAFVLLVWLPYAAVIASQDRSNIPSSAETLPGSRAPEHVVAEIRLALDAAISRFAAMDEAGVLAYVSPQYRTGTLTKEGIAEQLRPSSRFMTRSERACASTTCAWSASTPGSIRLARSPAVYAGSADRSRCFRGSGSWKWPVARTAGGVSTATSSDVFRLHFSPAARVTAALKCGSAIRDVT